MEAPLRRLHASRFAFRPPGPLAGSDDSRNLPGRITWREEAPMYEMPLAEGILAVVLEVARGEHVREIRVRAGALQRLVPDSLQRCLDRVAAGTPAEDAVLTVDVEPAQIACGSCEAVYELTTPPFMCG